MDFFVGIIIGIYLVGFCYFIWCWGYQAGFEYRDDQWMEAWNEHCDEENNKESKKEDKK